MQKKYSAAVIAILLIILISNSGNAWISEDEMSTSQKGILGCLGCTAFILKPFAMLVPDSVNLDETTIEINGTKMRVIKESIKKYPDGTISSAKPLEQYTMSVGSQKINFSSEGRFDFYPDGSIESGVIIDNAELLVGADKILFGCTLGSECSYCQGFDKLTSRYIIFYNSGAVRCGTLARKKTFRVEGRNYTLKHPDYVIFDQSGKPVKGCSSIQDGNKVYFQTKDFKD
jgi:hypothetical protein